MNCRQARWITELQEYNFTLHHKPAKQTSKQTSSQMTDHKGRTTTKTSQCSKPEWFYAWKFGIEGRDIEICRPNHEAMFEKKDGDRVVEKAIAGTRKVGTVSPKLCYQMARMPIRPTRQETS